MKYLPILLVLLGAILTLTSAQQNITTCTTTITPPLATKHKTQYTKTPTIRKRATKKTTTKTTKTTTKKTTKKTTKTTTKMTSSSVKKSISWQATGSGVDCPNTYVNTVWPTATKTISLPTASVISGEFDGKMAMYDRAGSGGDCQGQKEQGKQAAVFILQSGAVIKNVIIGARQAEGIHCLGPCRIENVWWDDVCEDAATFVGDGPRFIVGGGVRYAADKVFQHNGSGILHIDSFYAYNFGKLVRSCGNCSKQFQRHFVINNLIAIRGDIIGVNENYGDTALISNYCLSEVGFICGIFKGCLKPCESTKLSLGESPGTCEVDGEDI